MSKKSKRGQVTIFIIVSVIILVGVILYFLLRGGKGPLNDISPNQFSVQTYLEKCSISGIEKSLSLISSQGGYVKNPLNRTFKFEGEDEYIDISYLCYTSENYLSCSNQQPGIISHIENELGESLRDSLEECFSNLRERVRERGGDIQKMNLTSQTINIFPSTLKINLETDIIYTQRGETQKISKIQFDYPSRYYDLLKIVEEIVNQESDHCSFEYLGFMKLYPQWQIDKFVTGDSTKIYSVKNLKGNEKFKFAIKSCSFPTGLF